MVQQIQKGEGGENDEPEPEEDINRLVDDADGQDALSIVVLQ
jgi:hypothetical protein